MRIWNHIDENTRDRLRKSVTPEFRETINHIIEERIDKKDQHESLIEELRKEHYESAQLLPFF